MYEGKFSSSPIKPNYSIFPNIRILLQLFIQSNERKREEQVEGLLTYPFETLDMPKELGNSKGITKNPILKIELTKTNAFRVTTFGEYLDVKRKGRTPIAAKSKKEIPKKNRVKT
jgi:hypothetical protein